MVIGNFSDLVSFSSFKLTYPRESISLLKNSKFIRTHKLKTEDFQAVSQSLHVYWTILYRFTYNRWDLIETTVGTPNYLFTETTVRTPNYLFTKTTVGTPNYLFTETTVGTPNYLFTETTVGTPNYLFTETTVGTPNYLFTETTVGTPNYLFT